MRGTWLKRQRTRYSDLVNPLKYIQRIGQNFGDVKLTLFPIEKVEIGLCFEVILECFANVLSGNSTRRSVVNVWPWRLTVLAALPFQTRFAVRL